MTPEPHWADRVLETARKVNGEREVSTMTETKFTPVPWALVNGYNIFSELGADSGDGYKAPENDGWMIATVELGSVNDDLGETVELGHGVVRANAHLIAAAPKMYSALEAVVNHFDEWAKDATVESLSDAESYLSWLPDARAALAKARGES